MAILAHHGNADPEAMRAAFSAGLASLSWKTPSTMPAADNWAEKLDEVLPKLDQLKPVEKEKLVRALIEVVLNDGQMAPSELELLRVACDLIHVPLPMLTSIE
jgi:hypothetical protein